MNKALRISIVVVICLIVILGVALLISQCSSKEPDPTETTPSQTTPSQTTPSQTTPSQTTPSQTTPSGTTSSQGPVDDPDPDPDDFTETNDKVYVITAELNIRSSAEVVDGNIVGSVTIDTELTRLGYLDNGWSKIEYDGNEAYVSTKYVTTQKPITEFTEVNETVYIVEKNALAFSKPSHLEGYSEEVATLYIGESVTRLGVATEVYVDDEGNEYTFAKIKCTIDGEEKTCYVNNAYLTAEDPNAPDADAGITFEECDDVLVVIADESISLRKSAIWVDGDDEHNAAQVVGFAYNGDELQATHKGVEDDEANTVWYKVTVGDATYYVIFKADLLEIKAPAAE